MKIILINNYHYSKGGDSSVYLNMGKLLSTKGHRVSYLSMNHPLNEKSKTSEYFIKDPLLNKKNTVYQFLNCWKYIYSIEAKVKIKQLIERERPDIIHMHGIRGGITTSIIKVARKASIPIIQTVHDYHYLCPVNTMINGKGEICSKCAKGNYLNCTINKCEQQKYHYSMIHTIESYLKSFITKPLKNIDNLIFVSKFCQNKYLEVYPKLKEKSFVIYNFKPNNNINSYPKDFNEVYNSYYLYFGRINKVKGIYTLIRAFEKKPNLKLKIVGDGPEKENIANELKRKKIQNIDFIGFKKGKDLQDYIDKAKFVILPSEWYENNPMSIIEAYGSYKPVIGASIGGIPEILEDQVTGLLFKSGDIDDLVKKLEQAEKIDPKNYKDLCVNAYEFAKEKFNEEDFYNKMINVYKSTIKNYGRG